MQEFLRQNSRLHGRNAGYGGIFAQRVENQPAVHFGGEFHGGHGVAGIDDRIGDGVFCEAGDRARFVRPVDDEPHLFFHPARVAAPLSGQPFGDLSERAAA